ncbi:MAG: HepT-like ribonuclease domain-containing protein [Caulobacteraceae bacterium]
MLSDRDRLAWQDIADHCRLALGFADGLDSKGFARDQRTSLACVRCLEVIPEAARRLSPAVRESVEQPWKEIIGSGNIYRHDYQAVAPERVWKTVVEDLPGLLDAAEAALRD